MLTDFTDFKISNVGASAFSLSELPCQDQNGDGSFGVDFFSNEDLVIRTAASGGGTLLVGGIDGEEGEYDYVVSNKNNTLTADVSAALTNHNGTPTTKNIYQKITMRNAAYQNTNLWVTGKSPGDMISSNDLNHITTTIINKSADYTPPDMTGFLSFNYTCGVSTKKHTLQLSANNKNNEVEITKGDSGYGPVMIVCSGSDTINGLTTIFLWNQYETIRLRADGVSTYKVINDWKPIVSTGWVKRSEVRNVHIGTATITYDTSVGTFQVGDKVTGANGSYGICVYKDGTTLILASLVYVGANVFSNDEALTGDISGATALVNMSSAPAGLKNKDSNLYHGWGRNMDKIQVSLYYNTSASFTGASKISLATFYDGGSIMGVTQYQVDTNNLKLQSSGVGFEFLSDGGVSSGIIDTEDSFYCVIAKLTNW